MKIVLALFDNIISNIESGEKLLCTPEDALITSILAEEIIQNWILIK